METETSKKQYESRHRLTWAARYPLKPGRDRRLTSSPTAADRGDLDHRRVLDVSRDAGRAHGNDRSVESARILAKLCAEGALRAQHRGYRQTNIYTLMRLGEVAQYGDFLPLSDRTLGSSSHHGMTGHRQFRL